MLDFLSHLQTIYFSLSNLLRTWRLEALYSEIRLRCQTHSPAHHYGADFFDPLFDGWSSAWCFFGRLPHCCWLPPGGLTRRRPQCIFNAVCRHGYIRRTIKSVINLFRSARSHLTSSMPSSPQRTHVSIIITALIGTRSRRLPKKIWKAAGYAAGPPSASNW